MRCLGRARSQLNEAVFWGLLDTQTIKLILLQEPASRRRNASCQTGAHQKGLALMVTKGLCYSGRNLTLPVTWSKRQATNTTEVEQRPPWEKGARKAAETCGGPM